MGVDWYRDALVCPKWESFESGMNEEKEEYEKMLEENLKQSSANIWSRLLLFFHYDNQLKYMSLLVKTYFQKFKSECYWLVVIKPCLKSHRNSLRGEVKTKGSYQKTIKSRRALKIYKEEWPKQFCRMLFTTKDTQLTYPGWRLRILFLVYFEFWELFLCECKIIEAS